MSYEIVVFLGLVVKFWMLAIVVGLPLGIVMALVEVTATPVYNHELESAVDAVNVYEEEGFFYDLEREVPETCNGDIDKDIEVEEETIRLQLVLELAELHSDFNAAYAALVILDYEEVLKLAEEVFEQKIAA